MPENNKENLQETPTPNTDVEDTSKDTDTTKSEEVVNVEELRTQYKELFDKDVSNAKKNDVEWIKSKIDEEIKKRDSVLEDSTPNTDVEDEPKWKTKIELVTDVYYGWKKVKEGTVLELEAEELKKFAKSFYKKVG